MNIVKRSRTANTGRAPERLAMTCRALRGTCHLLYGRLAGSGFVRRRRRLLVDGGRTLAGTAVFLHPMTRGGGPFVLRALQPREDRLPFERFGTQPDLFDGAVAMPARCAARAQPRSSGRQGAAGADELTAFAGKKRWRRQDAHAAADATRRVTADWTAFAAAREA